MAKANNRRRTKKETLLEEEYLNCENATNLWAHVYAETRFNRRVVTPAERADCMYCNKRLLYLLAAAVFHRVERLVGHPSFRKLLRVTESYADGKATFDQFFGAYEKADAIPTDKYPAARTAAIWAIHLLPDDYKVLEGVDHVTDAAGYLAVIDSGELAKAATIVEARSAWQLPSFLRVVMPLRGTQRS